MCSVGDTTIVDKEQIPRIGLETMDNFPPSIRNFILGSGATINTRSISTRWAERWHLQCHSIRRQFGMFGETRGLETIPERNMRHRTSSNKFDVLFGLLSSEQITHSTRKGCKRPFLFLNELHSPTNRYPTSSKKTGPSSPIWSKEHLASARNTSVELCCTYTFHLSERHLRCPSVWNRRTHTTINWVRTPK